MENTKNKREPRGIANGFKSVAVKDGDKKNNLPIGTKFKLNGYEDPEYVMVKNLGVNENFPHYGARYVLVNLETFDKKIEDAFTFDHIEEKKDNRIHMYYYDEVLPTKVVFEVIQKAEAKEKRLEAAKVRASKIAAEEEARGRVLFEKYIPKTARALIVAALDVDNCDIQTDYFNVQTSKHVILGYSRHTRDMFSEMRKFADRIPETAHLKTPASINRPDEHREKYSMGSGYYLKAGGHYHTGWKIFKYDKYGEDWQPCVYRWMAQRCVFEKQN